MNKRQTEKTNNKTQRYSTDRNPEKATCIKDNVIFCNTLQAGASTRHVFSSNNDFYHAKNWLNEHPDFTNPKRQRMKARN
jgi:hypothetical protein